MSTFDKFRPKYDWKVLATGPGHGIQMRSGRLVVRFGYRPARAVTLIGLRFLSGPW